MLRCSFKAVVCFAVFFCGIGFAEAQTQKELEQQRARLTREINQTTRLLKSSNKSKAAALDRLVVIQRQIVKREELIVLLRLQISHADSSVGRTERVLISMQADVDALSAEYGRMARAALRQGLLDDRLAFLLLSESFSEALARTRYLKQYDENRSRQLELIQMTKDALQNKVDKLDLIRAEKKNLLEAELTQQMILEASLTDKNELLKSLAEDEDRLRRELINQTKDKDQLDRAIGDVITKSANLLKQERSTRERNDALAKAAEKNPAIKNSSSEIIEPARPKAPVVTSEKYTAALSQDFSKNRGRLPWPVEGGFISKPFGERAHPTLKSVKVRNNGVDIRTDPGSTVKAIFEGEVVGLQAVPGYNYMVILQHGDYFSVYSNLVDVRVKAGARVGTAEVIGAVAINANTNTSELHFEVWKERQTQNPAGWLKR